MTTSNRILSILHRVKGYPSVMPTYLHVAEHLRALATSSILGVCNGASLCAYAHRVTFADNHGVGADALPARMRVQRLHIPHGSDDRTQRIEPTVCSVCGPSPIVWLSLEHKQRKGMERAIGWITEEEIVTYSRM